MHWRTPFNALLTVPASLALAIGLLGWVATQAERTFGTPKWLLTVEAASAHSILSIVATGAMTALTLAYSLTLVVFTLAASSIGPRLLKRFTTERTNQITAGLLGGTFLYSIVALGTSAGQVPRIAALGSGFLAFMAVVQLIWFVRTVAQSVSIDDELAKIAARLERDLLRLRENSEIDVALPPDSAFRPAAETRQAGYLAQLDRGTLRKLATQGDIVVRVDHMPGEYLLKETPVMSIAGDTDAEIFGALEDVVRQEPARSDAEVVNFSLNLMVEIALRALSPGVNDTFTALAVTDMLSGALSSITRSEPRPEVLVDDKGAARVILPGASIRQLFDQAFAPLRRAASSNILMSQSLARAYQRLYETGNEETRAVIAEHVRAMRIDLERANHGDSDIMSVTGLMPGPLSKVPDKAHGTS
ncbi:hypothetical protein DEA8626_02551 [Defluviimonas aquaemixtae]|uniref:DUF2254 domain-containing protein n=1 Tax=Albidovulum aquaemixtae TaxID=1542388 RepID=A0A2R8BJD3_9RHOB|nr:DUF2254 family protein [Defluviimonas aquaemixtae]SPH23488.1 hypothetical protein DEA8626_02551 [Defluviimonas aquaemixtae]